MAIIHQTHDPILNSSAQVLVLPVNTAGKLLDPILARSKTLYPDNYQRYLRACQDGTLQVGSCLLHKCQREHTGLGAPTNSKQPSYIANLVVSDHPYHPTRASWLAAALVQLQQQLFPLIQHQGIRKIAILARPLLPSHAHNKKYSQEKGQERSQENNQQNSQENSATTQHDHTHTDSKTPRISAILPLDWCDITLPLITQHLQDLPRLRIELHMPRNMALVVDSSTANQEPKG